MTAVKLLLTKADNNHLTATIGIEAQNVMSGLVDNTIPNNMTAIDAANLKRVRPGIVDSRTSAENTIPAQPTTTPMATFHLNSRR